VAAAKLGSNQDDARQRICNWIDGTQRRSTAFDFVTKGVLQVRCVVSMLSLGHN
jgi:hypothetical protein